MFVRRLRSVRYQLWGAKGGGGHQGDKKRTQIRIRVANCACLMVKHAFFGNTQKDEIESKKIKWFKLALIYWT